MDKKDFRDKNKAGWDEETPMRVNDPDLNQESVTDAMRGDNNIPDAQPRKGSKPAEQS